MEDRTIANGRPDDEENVILDDQPTTPSKYDASFVKKTVYLDEMRESDPQGTIDRLYQRKELWKRTAQKVWKELQTVKKQNEEQLKQLRQLRKKYNKEKEMRQWWKIATFATGVGSAAVTAIVVSVILMVVIVNRTQPAPEMYRESKAAPMVVPTSGRAQQTPNHVLASVILYNGELQGSGTIISKGEKHAALLTAAHNFTGNIGGKFWLYYADGTYTEGTLVALDRNKDLALCKVDADTIITHAYIPESFPGKPEEMTSVGFANGKGPLFRKITYKEQFKDTSRNCSVWKFGVDSSYWDGDSGGGVFFDNALCAVATHRNYSTPTYYRCGNRWYQSAPTEDRSLFATSHNEIKTFLEANQETLADCGDWKTPPAMPAEYYGPPLWMPSPNVPIHVPHYVDQAEPLLKPSRIEEPDVPLKLKYNDRG